MNSTMPMTTSLNNDSQALNYILKLKNYITDIETENKKLKEENIKLTAKPRFIPMGSAQGGKVLESVNDRVHKRLKTVDDSDEE